MRTRVDRRSGLQLYTLFALGNALHPNTTTAVQD